MQSGMKISWISSWALRSRGKWYPMVPHNSWTQGRVLGELSLTHFLDAREGAGGTFVAKVPGRKGGCWGGFSTFKPVNVLVGARAQHIETEREREREREREGERDSRS